jgi:hypothetical protein
MLNFNSKITAVSVTSNFYFTGNIQNFTIPLTVSTIQFDIVGAAGGGGGILNVPGKGGRVVVTLVVVPGSTIGIVVGGQGSPSNSVKASGGFNGGKVELIFVQ